MSGLEGVFRDRRRFFTHSQMLSAGADGHLPRARLMMIPVHKIEGREPVPSMEGGYHAGRTITQPVEVTYSADNDRYMLYAGNHRVRQAEVNGDTHIPAFVGKEF